MGGHPVNAVVGATNEVGGDSLDPARIDLPASPRVSPRRFDHLGPGNPFRLLLEHAGAGPENRLAAAGDGVFVAVAAIGQAGKQAGENGAVDVIVLPAVGAAVFDAMGVEWRVESGE